MPDVNSSIDDFVMKTNFFESADDDSFICFELRLHGFKENADDVL